MAALEKPRDVVGGVLVVTIGAIRYFGLTCAAPCLRPAPQNCPLASSACFSLLAVFAMIVLDPMLEGNLRRVLLLHVRARRENALQE